MVNKPVEKFALMGCYGPSIGNFLQTFREKLSGPSCRVKNPTSYFLVRILLKIFHHHRPPPLKTMRRRHVISVLWSVLLEGYCRAFQRFPESQGTWKFITFAHQPPHWHTSWTTLRTFFKNYIIIISSHLCPVFQALSLLPLIGRFA